MVDSIIREKRIISLNSNNATRYLNNTMLSNVVFDFAKIDVQSAEVEVLSGATEFLKTTRKLVVECHHDYKNELKDTHKTVFRILNRHYPNVMYSEKYNLCYAWR